ncbi:MAG TPA: DUF2076 family protein [Streptosporangiaceae bacterium]|nr:DUF2076 family protein [Streptosporangiaceae bacterium]
MNRQDQQAIDDLFQHLNQAATQAGPPDAEADARIRQHIRQGPPTLVYQMAQTLVGQQAALRQLRAQVADLQQQAQRGGRPAGFAQPGQPGYGQPGYGGYGPPYQQQPYGYQRSGGGGFLAGAGQIALGVGGGILAAEALSDLFGGDGLFGGDRDYNDDRAYDQGYGDGRQDQERYDDNRQDDNSQYDDQGQYDNGGYDDGGGFDGGDFDGGGDW